MGDNFANSAFMVVQDTLAVSHDILDEYLFICQRCLTRGIYCTVMEWRPSYQDRK